MSNFVISTPHSSCSRNDGDMGLHSCDYSAAKWADFLAKKIKGSRKVFYGDTEKEVLDLSGEEARESEWRKQLREKLSVPETIYLEVHTHSPQAYPGVIVKYHPTQKGRLPQWIKNVHDALTKYSKVIIFDVASDSVEEASIKDVPSIYLSFEEVEDLDSDHKKMIKSVAKSLV